MRKYVALSTLSMAAVAVGAAFVGRRIRRFGEESEHVSETEESYRNAGTRILILGAGFGGLATALKLDQQLRASDDVSILVVDRNNDLLFSPLLWTVANGRANPNNVVVPIRNFQRGRRFHVLHAEVQSIDLDRKEVHTSVGSRPYDILVIALGSHTAVPDLPGLREHAIPFHTPADALELRNHLIDAIEDAHQTDDPQERQEWLTFVVGGAGDTGVELAATIHDYITSLFGEYPWLAHTPTRVVVVGRPVRVLPMSDLRTSRLVRQTLEREGIEVLTGRSVTGVTERTVETSAGPIPARKLFWAAGITAPDVVRELPVQHASNGAVIVDEYLRVPGHPEVYVLGDAAWAYDSITGDPVPPTAQAARQQGNYVGEAIAEEYAGRPARVYRYKILGHLALLGHYTGVAEIGPVAFEGLPAWILWHLAYLLRNPSWAKRIRLAVDWLLSGILGREIGQLRLDTELTERRRVLQPQIYRHV
ncbi:MAG TPA: NAD(P)/FAD-dependent oxidoreductase [Ktedonobacteraceae bacterium]